MKENLQSDSGHVLITGGSRGIGKAIARKFASEGFKVGICGRTKSTLEQTSIQIREEYNVKCDFFIADALDPEAFGAALNKYFKDYGYPDVLINNVGGGGRWGSSDFTQTPYKTWLDVINKNLGAAVIATNLVVPEMKKKGFGRVITISSRGAKEIGPRPWFSTAKAGQIFFMKGLAKDPNLVRAGISFVTIAPGAIEIEGTGWDEMQKNDPEGFKEFVNQEFPLGRLGLPQEVAEIVFFCSKGESMLLNGSFIGVDGGESDYF
jgi:NAD(P)-dependent dehydrogenase (short-subunit alcohol dehydrogenase family)